MQRYYPTMSLGDRIATPDGKRRYVRTLFATIADRYDFITVALSYGQDRRWKRRVVGLASPRRGLRALDLATGTGDIAFALAARGASVVGLDVTLRMIELAMAKRERRSAESVALRSWNGARGVEDAGGGDDARGVEVARGAQGARGFQPSVCFLVGDMLALPFPS